MREGASLPEALILRARELGYPALALTGHDGLYGAMTFAQTATAWGIRPITGVEATLHDASHLTLLAETRQGYGNLCQLISAARTTNHERPVLDPDLLAAHAEGLILLTGCRKGEVSRRAAVGELAGAADAVPT